MTPKDGARTRNLNEASLTEAVLARLDGVRDPRFKRIMTALVVHLHAFVRETELTEAEWFEGIDFLTKTGQMCDDKRQEFILLSDTLGVSMLVDAVNHKRPGNATENTVLGPFYVPGARAVPIWADLAEGVVGTPAYVSGHVLDVQNRPIAGATVDVWQTDGDGFYDVQRAPSVGLFARGKITTNAEGAYAFRTVKPVSYAIPTDGPVGKMLLAMGRHPYRPAHVHTIVSAPGYERVTTHLFVAGDPYLDSDAVFAVKEALLVPFVARAPGITPDGSDSAVPFETAEYDFRLVPATTRP